MTNNLPSCSVFIATSLDGFIAKPDGDIEWLHNPDYFIEGEDFGYADFMSQIDVIVMGRNTFHKVQSFDSWPYEKPVIVLSSHIPNAPFNYQEHVEFMNGSPFEILEKLRSGGYRRVYLDGGRTISTFLKEGLVENLIISQMPVLLGDGIPLFLPQEQMIPLTLRNVKSFENGIIQFHYQPQNKRDSK